MLTTVIASIKWRSGAAVKSKGFIWVEGYRISGAMLTWWTKIQKVKKNKKTFAKLIFSAYYICWDIRDSKYNELRLTENTWEAYWTGAIQLLQLTDKILQYFVKTENVSLHSLGIVHCLWQNGKLKVQSMQCQQICSRNRVVNKIVPSVAWIMHSTK